MKVTVLVNINEYPITMPITKTESLVAERNFKSFFVIVKIIMLCTNVSIDVRKIILLVKCTYVSKLASLNTSNK